MSSAPAGVPPRHNPPPEPAPLPDRFWFCLHLGRTAGELSGEAAGTECHRLATWATRFTPAVSLAPPGALLLEVRASLRLFGGTARLGQRLDRGLRRRHPDGVVAGAPTARAALWLARAGRGQVITASRELASQLASLPLVATGWDEGALELLSRMGITRLGECLRLPRQGFARRLGPARLRELDQALGRAPEVHRWHEPPVRFRETLDLEPALSEGPWLQAALLPLLEQLDARLRVHQAGIRTLWCRLAHAPWPARREDAPADTWLRIGLRRPSGDGNLIRNLLGLRLAATRLPAPVTSLLLLADLEVAAEPEGLDLLGQPLVSGAPLAALLDRLRTRLGGDAVHGIETLPEHRPEWAWRRVVPGFPPGMRQSPRGARQSPPAGKGRASPVPLLPAGPRPLWLLPAPRRLGSVAGQPAWRGPLALEEGPERIETGWWDGGDIRRDYYRARARDGALLWVFRDLRTGDWHLHGLFG